VGTGLLFFFVPIARRFVSVGYPDAFVILFYDCAQSCIASLAIVMLIIQHDDAYGKPFG